MREIEIMSFEVKTKEDLINGITLLIEEMDKNEKMILNIEYLEEKFKISVLLRDNKDQLNVAWENFDEKQDNQEQNI